MIQLGLVPNGKWQAAFHMTSNNHYLREAVSDA
jgi:hypothetical protein